jgi:DNA primase
LKNFARRVVLAYDADAAGQAAAERFYEWEQRYEVDIAVAALPRGMDPADVARDDPAALKAMVEEARPFLAFRIERAISAADLRSPEGRARAAGAALVAIREHPNELVRDQYVMQVAERCRLEPDRLREQLARRPEETSVARARTRPVASRVVLPGSIEEEALLLAIHRPGEMAGLLHEALFADEVHAAAFRVLAESATLPQALDRAGPEVAALLQRLAVEETDAEPDDVVAAVAQRAAQRAIEEVRVQVRTADDVSESSAVIAWLKQTVDELRESGTRADAVGQLVPWLAARVEERE